MTQTTIDLIRHGEPEGGSKFRGYSIDDPLSEKGWQQMQHAVGDYNEWDCIVSSPMLRCKLFAEQLAIKNNVPLTIKSDFKEVGFGNWEGKTADEIKLVNPEEYEAFYLDPVNSRPTNAEDIDFFCDRVVKSYNQVLQDNIGKHCLIVAHAGVIRAIVSHVLCASPLGMYRINIKNAGLARIKYSGNIEKLEFINGVLD
ncbi:MAG: histidine phosphatase family protein [Gammaproteobacteria bacterium]|nr:histidine phosphatase family protein [Gammaproteobacteria bacterium]